MNQNFRKLSAALLPFLLLFANSLLGQVGFCPGNTGQPIFTEDFGSGTTNGPPLPPGSTTYQYVNGEPTDGSYTIASTTPYFDWHRITDHTPNDSNGKAFIVNADYSAGEFFRRTVTGLCENTSYEFSSWLLNLLPASGCSNNGIPINVRFEIWDVTDTQRLAWGDTGDLHGTPSPLWQQYGLLFQTLPGQTSVILKMRNNGEGGCGNDLAIDDIVFRTCGDAIAISDEQGNLDMAFCETAPPSSVTLTATPDYSIYTSHAFQWQDSPDGIVWSDIPGETSPKFTSPLLDTTTFFRVKLAEDVINLANPLCNTLSEVFKVTIVPKPQPPTSNGDIATCINENKSLTVSAPEDVQVNWYDAPSGGNLLLENSTSFLAPNEGTFYAEAVSTLAACYADSRTAIKLTHYELPVVTDETIYFCEDDSVILYANTSNATYEWNTGETTPSIVVDSSGTYSLIITNSHGCQNTKKFTLFQIDRPLIESVRSDEYTITVLTENLGAFEYSLDGIYYQYQNSFKNTEGGHYTIYVREKNGCGLTTMEYLHLVIPKFFTPNGDHHNDLFIINGTENFGNAELHIYDRYGNLLKSIRNAPFIWDGTFKNRDLPASDYWYSIKLDHLEKRGHFTLKR
ncbi:MAG: T9SS type B sorting domain-containing protein [Arenibacter sp.]|nr:T9SS type B sorting domain-containing protein [Arenibacter sp.]